MKFDALNKFREGHWCVQGIMSCGIVEGMKVPTTGVVCPKDSLIILNKRKSGARPVDSLWKVSANRPPIMGTRMLTEVSASRRIIGVPQI
jgi:hypothetical protein